MRAVKSHSSLKIMNTNNGLVFYCDIFRIYSALSSKFIYSMKLGYLRQRWSYGRFSRTTYRFLPNEKLFVDKTYNYVKLRQYEMISTKQQILHSLGMFFVPLQAFAQTFTCFANSTACAIRPRKRDELTSCWFVSACSRSVVFVITIKLWIVLRILTINLIFS